jgi:hypothetical protein
MSDVDMRAARAAASGQYVLCYSDPSQSTLYLSSDFHIDVAPGPDGKSQATDNGASANALADLRSKFLAFIQKQYGYRSTSSYPAYCQGSQLEDDVTNQRETLHSRFSKVKFVETGWHPGADSSAPAPASSPVAAAPQASIAGTYSGSYICGGRTRSLTLVLSGPENGLVTAHFTAYQPPESHDKPYTFLANGHFDPATGKFKLMPLKWETPAPPNMMMVGLTGTFDAKTSTVRGTIDFTGCTTFEVRRGGNDHLHPEIQN